MYSVKVRTLVKDIKFGWTTESINSLRKFDDYSDALNAFDSFNIEDIFHSNYKSDENHRIAKELMTSYGELMDRREYGCNQSYNY